LVNSASLTSHFHPSSEKIRTSQPLALSSRSYCVATFSVLLLRRFVAEITVYRSLIMTIITYQITFGSRNLAYEALFLPTKINPEVISIPYAQNRL
jgi:hypothetical protein